MYMIHPMRLQEGPKDREARKKLCDSKEYYGSIKRDGSYYTAEICDDGEFLFARDESKKTPGMLTEKSANVPHVFDRLRATLPKNTVLVGEIYYPGKKSNDTTKIMGCLPDKALIRQGLAPQEMPPEGSKKKFVPEEILGPIHYYVHDILVLAGESLLDKTHWERAQLLKELAPSFVNEFVEYAEIFEDNLDQLIDDFIEAGEEGMVLKKKDEYFIPGKRPVRNWLKFKCEETHDVIVTGFEPANKEYDGEHPETWLFWEDESGQKHFGELFGKGLTPIKKPYFYGWPGAVKVAVVTADPHDGKQVYVPFGTVASGFTDADCQDMLDHPENWLNQPIEVLCMNVLPDGFRHGRYVRTRNDLNLSDCTYEKLGLGGK